MLVQGAGGLTLVPVPMNMAGMPMTIGAGGMAMAGAGRVRPTFGLPVPGV
jgi:hypothetical protein